MQSYTSEQVQDTLKIIDSTILSCEKIQAKAKVGAPQQSLITNRIQALTIAKDCMTTQGCEHSKEELEQAIIQINSIKSKSVSGTRNAKEGSATFTRFVRLIAAMDMILAYLQLALIENKG